MNAVDLHRIRDIFEHALEMAPAERASYVSDACAHDAVARDHVMRLIAAHEQTCALIDGSQVNAIRPVTEPEAAGRRFGPYMTLRLLGHGGMGAVYLAEREIGRTRQRVALKVIRPGIPDMEGMLRRFRLEQEMLATLEHPNIARFLGHFSARATAPKASSCFSGGTRMGEPEPGGHCR